MLSAEHFNGDPFWLFVRAALMLGDLIFRLLFLHLGVRGSKLGTWQQSVRALRACPYEIKPEQKSAPCGAPCALVSWSSWNLSLRLLVVVLVLVVLL